MSVKLEVETKAQGELKEGHLVRSPAEVPSTTGNCFDLFQSLFRPL